MQTAADKVYIDIYIYLLILFLCETTNNSKTVRTNFASSKRMNKSEILSCTALDGGANLSTMLDHNFSQSKVS